MTRRTTLTDAIRQTRPFESVPVEAMLTLAWASDRIQRISRAPLCRADVSPAQYNVLRILRGSPGGLETREIVRRMVTRAPNLTRLLDKLEAKGLLDRRRSTEDRRVITVHIRPEGLDLLETLDAPLAEAIADATRGLDEPGLRQLIHLLTELAGVHPESPEPTGP